MDTDLVIRAQRGDKGAYALVATEIASRFLAVARRILRDLDLAEDATQQALLTIWRDLPSSATRRASTPGRTGCSSVPATPKAGANAVGLPNSGSSRLIRPWRTVD